MKPYNKNIVKYFSANLHRRGFTLIELSIVLVVIGLIVGGVLVGRDLINASQLRAQVTQFEKINTAVSTFKGKYNCLPGDCANFTSFFPSFSPAALAAVGQPSNGNGDGTITELNNGACCNTSSYPYEVLTESILFWEMLYTANLTACCDPVKSVFVVNTIGVTFPKDMVNGFGISVATLGGRNGYFWAITTNTNGIAYANDYVTLAPNNKGVSTPAQTQKIDAKIDDGIATTGNVYAAALHGGDNHVHPLDSGFLNNCLTNVTTPPSYDISASVSTCTLWINMQ